MEASGIFKLRRNFLATGVLSPEVGDVRNGEIEDEDSFFDLVIKSSDSGGINGSEKEGWKKDFDFIESPMDDFLSKIDFANSKPNSPVTPLRSTPKFKVFILGLRKRSKSAKTESNSEFKAISLHKLSKSSKIALKCSGAEELPVADNSLRSQMLRESSDLQASYDVVSTEKSFPKYLKLIKPFYTKASKKAKVTVSSTPSCSPATEPVNLSHRKFSEESRISSFKIVARKLVKSRSTSAAVGMPHLPPPRRRDDVLLEQQDGIQAAILHCKKSYSSSCEEPKRFSI